MVGRYRYSGIKGPRVAACSAMAFAALLFGVWAFHAQTAGILLMVGASAPDFTGPAVPGSSVHLYDVLTGKRVVLVFYPGDNTAVCTAQLCALRDIFKDLSTMNCTVLGINPAAEGSHKRFAEEHNFPFPLVVDKSGSIARLYGCAGAFGINRRTVYIIGKDRKVLYAERGNPPVSELLHVLQSTPR